MVSASQSQKVTLPRLWVKQAVTCPDGPFPAAGEGAGGGGKCCRRLPLERICAQYGFGFFAPEKSKFVASTAKRQRGLQRGKPGSPLPCFASFCRSKRKAPAASGANYAFAKGSVTPTGEIKLLPFAGNPSVSLAADSSPYTGEPVVQGDAASLPLARGRLWGGARGRG